MPKNNVPKLILKVVFMVYKVAAFAWMEGLNAVAAHIFQIEVLREHMPQSSHAATSVKQFACSESNQHYRWFVTCTVYSQSSVSF